MSVLLLIAPSGMGKTTACRSVIELARKNNLRVAGLLSIPVYENQAKTSIVLHDIVTGQEHLLARTEISFDGPSVGIWTFEPESLHWGRRILSTLPECDLLIIDEIGPLELVQHQGLHNALEVVRKSQAYLAVISLRPTLVEAAFKEFEGLEVSTLILDEANRANVPTLLLNLLTERLTDSI